jgi:hypothetical protein
MTEGAGIDGNQARDNGLHETPLVPKSAQDAADDPRSTEEPTYRDGNQTVRASSHQPGGQS